MSLKRSYAKKEEIPQGAAEHYVERDGAFVLDLDGGFKTDDDVANVKKALDKERADHKAAKEKLKAFDGIDPEAVRADQEELETLRASGGKGVDAAAVEKRVGAKFEREKKTLSDQIATLQQENAGFKAEKVKSTIEGSMRKAFEGTSGLLSSASEDFLRGYANVFELSEDGKVVSKENSGVRPGVEPAEVLADILKTKTHWLESSQGANPRPGDRKVKKSADDVAEFGDIVGEAYAKK